MCLRAWSWNITRMKTERRKNSEGLYNAYSNTYKNENKMKIEMCVTDGEHWYGTDAYDWAFSYLSLPKNSNTGSSC